MALGRVDSCVVYSLACLWFGGGLCVASAARSARFWLTSEIMPLAASRGETFPKSTSVLYRFKTSIVADDPAGNGIGASMLSSAMRSR